MRSRGSRCRRLIEGEGVRDVAFDLVGTPEGQVRSGGYERDIECAALWCLANASSYAEFVLAAVNLGDDTDTTAAVAGGFACIVYGIDAIPVQGADALLGTDVIESCLF